MSSQFLPFLSRDLTKLLENKKNYDFMINVGNDDDNKKEFCLHSMILETRSSYFEDVLSNGLVKKEDNVFILDFPDISVNAFNVLIGYIYGGSINLDHKEAADILNLLIACEKFKLKELYEYIQDYLIKNHQDWFYKNFVLIQQVSYKYSEFAKLQNYWATTVCEEPEILFNATDFTSVDKEALLSLYKDKNLCMEEDKLWEHVIRWGKAQNIELPEDIDDWTANDFSILKKTIEDFIPYIKFYDISSENFCYKIMPYNTILPSELYQDLSKYYLVPNWQPKFNNFPLTKIELGIFNDVIDVISSKLINNEQAALISSWIQGNDENKISDKFNKVLYKFQLLARGSRDGFTKEIFHNKCDNKGPTVVVTKLKDETSIIGGYNPISWDTDKHGNYEKTSDSFIFSLDKEIILSRVQVCGNAIFQSNRGISFRDLQLIDTFNSEKGVYCIKRAYGQEIHVQGFFAADEYEVFSVVESEE